MVASYLSLDASGVTFGQFKGVAILLGLILVWNALMNTLSLGQMGSGGGSFELDTIEAESVSVLPNNDVLLTAEQVNASAENLHVHTSEGFSLMATSVNASVETANIDSHTTTMTSQQTTIDGVVESSGAINASGPVTSSGDVTATGAVTSTGNVDASGAVAASGSITSSGAVTSSGSVTSTGPVTATGGISASSTTATVSGDTVIVVNSENATIVRSSTHKFAYNPDIDELSVPEVIRFSGGPPNLNSVSGTLTLTSNPVDAGNTIRIHGFNSAWEEATEDIALDGSGTTVTATSWWSITRMFVTGTSPLTTDLTSSLAGADGPSIPAEDSQTQSSIIAVPPNERARITEIFYSIGNAQGTGKLRVSLRTQNIGSSVIRARHVHFITELAPTEMHFTVPINIDGGATGMHVFFQIDFSDTNNVETAVTYGVEWLAN